MTNSVMFFHSPGATCTRASTLRRASASCTSRMERTEARKSSSKSSTVRTVPLDGWMAEKLRARPSDRIERALRMIPTAKMPTAIESTISTVRILLPSRSLSTLYQRALSMDVVLDDLAVRQRDDARAAPGHILVVRNHEDRAALLHQVF